MNDNSLFDSKLDAKANNELRSILNSVCKDLKAQASDIKPWFSGSRNYSFLILDRFILRVTRRDDAEIAFSNERKAMSFLSNVKLTPNLISYGKESGWHWQLTSRCKGIPVTHAWEKLSSTEKENLTESIVKELLKLQKLTPPQSKLMNWTKSSLIQRCRVNIQATPRLNSTQLEFILDSINVFETNSVEEDNFVHADFHFGNLLCEGPLLTGIVDLEWSGFGSFARDLCNGDYFDQQSSNSYQRILTQFAKQRMLGTADFMEIAKWSLLWKLHQVCTRNNSKRARVNKDTLINICTLVQRPNFYPPSNLQSLIRFLSHMNSQNV